MNSDSSPDRRRLRTRLGLILALSLALDLLGVWWGRHHPDDLTSHALYMLARGTLRPPHFWYPTLFTYAVLLFSVIPSKAVEVLASLSAGYDLHDALSSARCVDFVRPSPRDYLAPRVMTACIGTLGVYLLYRLGRLIAGARAGLLAALLLSVCMGYAANAHFATADVPVTVMILFFFLLCLRAAREPSAGRYAAAALTIGLATSVKYYGILLLCPFLFAYFSPSRRRRLPWRRVPFFLLLVAAGFIAGTPYSVLSFFAFVRGVLQLNILTPSIGLVGFSAPHGYVTHLKNLVNLLGLPLFVLAAASLPYSLYAAVKGRKFEFACIWAFILPFCLIVGSLRSAPARYILPVVPFLLLFASCLVDRLLRAPLGPVRSGSRAVLAGVAAYSFLYSVAGDFHFILDGKRSFLAWAAENIPDGASIELTTYAPRPRGPYTAYYRPHAGGNDRYYSILRQSALYRFALRQGIIWKHLATRWRMPGEEIIDRSMRHFLGRELPVISKRPSADFDYSLKGLYERAPDYLVVNHYFGMRFTGNRAEYPAQNEFYTALFSDSDPRYRRVAVFSPPRFPFLDPQVQFADDYISVYRRIAARGAP